MGGGWNYSSTLLTVGSRWKCVVGFTLPQIFSHDRKRRDHSVGVWAGRGACIDALEKRHNSAPNL